MGAYFSRLWDRLRGVEEVRLLMLGLDNAGKTTILYKLKFNETISTIPTAGFNTECLVHRNVKFFVWDVGGQDKIRPLWRHYHTGTRAVVFVIDSQDTDRIGEARTELHRILTARELASAVVLIYANKQDLPMAMTVEQVKEKLQLDKFPQRIWAIVGSCATDGDGLIDGFNWLADHIRAVSANAAESKPVASSSSETNVSGQSNTAFKTK